MHGSCFKNKEEMISRNYFTIILNYKKDVIKLFLISMNNIDDPMVLTPEIFTFTETISMFNDTKKPTIKIHLTVNPFLIHHDVPKHKNI